MALGRCVVGAEGRALDAVEQLPASSTMRLPASLRSFQRKTEPRTRYNNHRSALHYNDQNNKDGNDAALDVDSGSFVWREEFSVPVTDVPASSPMQTKHKYDHSRLRPCLTTNKPTRDRHNNPGEADFRRRLNASHYPSHSIESAHIIRWPLRYDILQAHYELRSLLTTVVKASTVYNHASHRRRIQTQPRRDGIFDSRHILRTTLRLSSWGQQNIRYKDTTMHEPPVLHIYLRAPLALLCSYHRVLCFDYIHASLSTQILVALIHSNIRFCSAMVDISLSSVLASIANAGS
ncbi:hypothetical protein B0H14DRAFT_3123521 [Mycena olivaceomarginata]|nr:hypothetical protein B0H14DRAFT_3123521 [Mycena olivaceomarginata]